MQRDGNNDCKRDDLHMAESDAETIKKDQRFLKADHIDLRVRAPQ